MMVVVVVGWGRRLMLMIKMTTKQTQHILLFCDVVVVVVVATDMVVPVAMTIVMVKAMTIAIYCYKFNGIAYYISTLMAAAERQCRNITADEAPRNGGLICHWFGEENSASCNVICNPGYERAAGIRDIETCGPATGFRWTFEVAGDAHEGHMTHHCVGEWISTIYIVNCCEETNILLTFP